MLYGLQTLLFALFLFFLGIALIKAISDNQRIMERRTEAMEDIAFAMGKIAKVIERELEEE